MKIIEDKRGVTEEFTSLPAIMVVMIGFALFFAMITSVYHVHNERMKNMELYDVAHYVIMKLTNRNSPLVSQDKNTPLIIDKRSIKSNNINLKEFCSPVGYDYQVKIYDLKEEFSENIGNEPEGDRVAVSRKIAIKFDEGDIRCGEIVVIVWRV